MPRAPEPVPMEETATLQAAPVAAPEPTDTGEGNEDPDEGMSASKKKREKAKATAARKKAAGGGTNFDSIADGGGGGGSGGTTAAAAPSGPTEDAPARFQALLDALKEGREAPKKVPQPPPKKASNDGIVLSNSTLDRSVRALGAPSSLDPLFTRLVLGLPIMMGVLGASVAQNAGCLEQPAKRCQFYNGKPGKGPKGWAIRLFEHINATFPHAGHRLYNAALDATPVSLFSDCLFSHLPSEVHLVVAEWGSMGLLNYKHLPSIERVVRILLRLPSQPMIVHLSSPEWCTQRRTPRAFYRTGDRLMGGVSNFIYPDTPWARVELETTRVCHHYEQACVSMKEALEPHVLNGDTGFSVHDLLVLIGTDWY